MTDEDKREANAVWSEVERAVAKWFLSPTQRGEANYEILLLSPEPTARVKLDYGRTATLALPSAVEEVDGAAMGVSVSDIRGLFFTPLMLRLNYVAQLSTSYLRANLDAKHCRLSHAIGTVAILASILSKVLKEIEGDQRLERCQPTRLEVVSALVYAALHDAFQGPFGHSLDPLRDCLLHQGHHSNRRLDKALFSYICALAYACADGEYKRYEIEPPEGVAALCKAVKLTVADPLGLELTEIFDFLTKVADPNLRSAGMEQINWLFDLLEGPLDADRWDYLWRDTLHLGFLDYHDQVCAALSDFLGNIGIHFDGKISYLRIDREVASSLGRRFFYIRKHLYNTIYEHPGKQLIDASLNRAVYWTLLRDFQIPPIDNWFAGEYSRRVTNFAHLTDSSLLDLLEFNIESGPSAVSSLFVQELLVYPTYSVGFELSITPGEAQELLLAAKEVVDETQQASSPSEPDGRFRLPQSLVVEQASETRRLLSERRRNLVEAGVIKPGDPPLLELILHCHLIAYNPAACLQFDRLLWKRMRERTDIGSLIVRTVETTIVARVEAVRTGLKSTAVTEAILAFPPVFSTFPWIPEPEILGVQGLKRTPYKEKFAVREPNGVITITDPGGIIPASEVGDEIVFAVGFPLFAVRGVSSEDLERFSRALGEVASELLRSGFCLTVPEYFRGPDFDEPLLNALRSA